MGGLEATRRLRLRYGKDAPPRVVAMTANAMPGDREKCLAAGMTAYVSKPVELEDLRAVLCEVAGVGKKPSEEADTTVIDRRRIDQLFALQDESNPTLVADIVELFLSDSPKHLENLASAVSEQSPERVKATAHRFLSSIENLGAQRMRLHCMELERLGKSGRLDGAAAHLAGLEREFDIARQHLQSLAAPA